MFRLLTLTLCVGATFAQTPADLFNKPPADVDQALRARITEFFQDHVDGKYRQAEALVAEDTKDFFYTSNKPKYVSFEIKSITYSEGYTKARALVVCEQYVPFPEFGGKPIQIPTPSDFKLVDGQWYWYIDPAVRNQSPFGTFKGGPGKPTGQIAIPSPDEVLRNASQQVRVDKLAVMLVRGGADQVMISNTAPGVMTVSVVSATAGIDVSPDHFDLKSGEKVPITLRSSRDAKPGNVTLRVEQTNVLIPIQVGIQ